VTSRPSSLAESRPVTFDAGVLIAFERGERWTVLLVDAFLRNQQLRIAVPTGAAAQAYRQPRTQVALNRLLGHARVDVVPLDLPLARAAGALCAARGTADIVDASVVLCARTRGGRVATTDHDDLRRLDPSIRLIPPL
jgi:predicted nucleic acid-binding protein